MTHEEAFPFTLEVQAARERGERAERLTAALHAPPASPPKRRGLPAFLLQRMAITAFCENPHQPSFQCWECGITLGLEFVAREKVGVGPERLEPRKTVDFCPQCRSDYRRHKFEYQRRHLL